MSIQSNQSHLDKLLEKVSNKENQSELTDNSEELSTLKLKDQHIQDLIQDRTERKKYANKTFNFLRLFTLATLVILTASGFHDFLGFKISDSVLITLITSSFASVVGIFILVMRYLFKHSK